MQEAFKEYKGEKKKEETRHNPSYPATGGIAANHHDLSPFVVKQVKRNSWGRPVGKEGNVAQRANSISSRSEKRRDIHLSL